MLEAATSLAANPPGSAELPHRGGRAGTGQLEGLTCLPGLRGSGCSSVFPGATRGATQFLYQTFALCNRARYLCVRTAAAPPPPPAQPRAFSRTTALCEHSVASSGSSPSSDLLTIDTSFIFHATHSTAEGMHCSHQAGLRSKVASVSRQGVFTACTVGQQSLCCGTRSCASVFTGSRASPPKLRSLALGFLRRVPFSLLWIRGFPACSENSLRSASTCWQRRFRRDARMRREAAAGELPPACAAAGGDARGRLL